LRAFERIPDEAEFATNWPLTPSFMTNKEIVRSISDELGLPQLQVKQIVQKMFSALIETLAEDGRVELRNFGVFEVKVRAARSARNPKTGEQMPIPARSVVTFKPGKEMEEQVQEAAARKARLAKLANSAGEHPASTPTITPPTVPPRNPDSPEG
jgi:nucleoid DNA-binding protein